MDRWQYVVVLGCCLALTAPLEIFGAGVYRQPRRMLAAVLPVAAAFVAWDLAAIAAHVWTYSPRFTTGVVLPGRIPIEEVLFFVVIPLCGLLTYNAVGAILGRLRRIRTRSARRS
ncbi:lycopene cyclase domain-containing protein [Mycobacterium heckeshornense]|uniref:Lycopene cyclase n=1 Tax=Mycobacterium heckeshornense TaxID=110505 RepID=A0A2G8BJF8_9MYCO|nr:lycopene cyclase domain-containing protein [Mycobacterium heckeshornense]KMV24447.1 lycopene cyclase [Mycobacterium heckeshornense]MCV7035513.1 lycopene cyclase domain-containing protein [Mycobacterium heckeshornense]PIJ37923.1 lycopene cyclase domain-containing protein [Mycobacterium heckeshornense]BCO37889.1 lycopene cyclase [Mycobacterium heckeshornense]BCQ10755.1 lycopene cyclase [Mycobacterium heckeshornense]